MAKNDVNMLSGSIVKGLLSISVPVMIMNVMTSLFNIIDMTVLKTYDPGNGIAIGAVGVCGTLIALITGLVIGVSAGANVLIAKNIGRKDQAGVDRAVGTAIAFSVVAGLGLAVIGICGAELFLQWTNCPEELLDQATLYFRLYFAGAPLLMFYNFCAAILRSTGDSRRPMIFLIVGGAVKVSANFVLISQFKLGVTGVAIGTILSWSLCAFLGGFTLAKNQSGDGSSIRGRFRFINQGTVLRLTHVRSIRAGQKTCSFVNYKLYFQSQRRVGASPGGSGRCGCGRSELSFGHRSAGRIDPWRLDFAPMP